MATLILVRHGRTTANTSGVLAGRAPGVRLDETGEQQVAATGDRLSALRLAAVVTSPLERCRQTARAIATRQQDAGRPHQEKRLVEVDYGEWTGRELTSLAKEDLWRSVQGHPSSVTFPGGESMSGMAARAVGGVRDWDARVEAEHGAGALWCAVSHGDVIKAVLADALGMHLDVFQRLVVDPASVSVVRYTAGRPFVLMVNTHAGELGHLAAPPPKARRGSRARSRRTDSDAVVGGGAGPGTPATGRGTRG